MNRKKDRLAISIDVQFGLVYPIPHRNVFPDNFFVVAQGDIHKISVKRRIVIQIDTKHHRSLYREGGCHAGFKLAQPHRNGMLVRCSTEHANGFPLAVNFIGFLRAISSPRAMDAEQFKVMRNLES